MMSDQWSFIYASFTGKCLADLHQKDGDLRSLQLR